MKTSLTILSHSRFWSKMTYKNAKNVNKLVKLRLKRTYQYWDKCIKKYRLKCMQLYLSYFLSPARSQNRWYFKIQYLFQTRFTTDSKWNISNLFLSNIFMVKTTLLKFSWRLWSCLFLKYRRQHKRDILRSY